MEINEIQLPVEPLSVNENMHEKYAEEEKAILATERKITRQIGFLEDRLIKGSQNVADQLIQLGKELDQVLSLKKRFIELGWPSRHNHTNEDGDDGRLSPKELVDYAIKNSITILYICGHNSFKGSIEGIKYAKECGHIIEMRPASEINAPLEHHGELLEFDWKIIIPLTTEEIEELTQEASDRLEAVLSTLYEAVLALKDDPSVKQELKDLLSDLPELDSPNFKDLGPPKWLNFNNVIGNWTKELGGRWKESAEPRRAVRKLMRERFGFSAAERMAEEQGKKYTRVLRAEEVAQRFSELGCRVIAAHPVRNIYPTQDINREEFVDRLVDMVKKGWVHGLETGYRMYSKEERIIAEEIVQEVQRRCQVDFVGEGSNPDFHYYEPYAQDIKLGAVFEDSNGEFYWSLKPDRVSYFIEGEFLIRSHLKRAQLQISKSHYQAALRTLNEALDIHPYSKEASELKVQIYQEIAKGGS